MDIKIVKPTIEDVRGTIEVQYKTWLATYPNKKAGITIDDIEYRYKDAFSPERLKKREEMIVSQEPNEKYIVAKDGDRVPEYHGRGIGTKLWNAVLPFFDKTKDIYVEVADYNEKAIGFYKKLGFIDTGRRFSDERFKMKSGAMLPEMEMKISVTQ